MRTYCSKRGIKDEKFEIIRPKLRFFFSNKTKLNFTLNAGLTEHSSVTKTMFGYEYRHSYETNNSVQ